MLEEKVFIVTGGATGIGYGIVQSLLTYGAHVAIVQPSSSEACSVAARFSRASGFGADISNHAQVETMVEQVYASFGRVDGLVNNAALTGSVALAPFLSASVEHVSRIIDVNLKGTIWCSQMVAKRMVASGVKGSIVNIASVGAFAAQQLASAYCISKAGVVALTRSMALELAPYGMRVNAVAPGDVPTAAGENSAEQFQAVSDMARLVRETPFPRKGQPVDIGEAVAFLLSSRASFITGSVLTVDGGLLTY